MYVLYFVCDIFFLNHLLFMILYFTVQVKEVINRHQTMNLLESDLDRWLHKRDELSQRSDQLKVHRETILQATEVCTCTCICSLEI